MRTKKLTNKQAQKNISKSHREYDQKNIKSITFRMSKNRDADLINYISSIENKADWFRSLVLKDMKNNGRD
jgi:hypothetical protein